MYRILAIALLFSLAEIPAIAQTPSPSTPQESSSRAQPDAPPSPDAPIPDAGTQTSPPPKSKAKKIANKFDPHCIDVIFHACWSSPAAPQGKVPSKDEKKSQQAAEDIEVGYFYLNKNNFLAAESRLREAVDLRPDAAAAWVGLAQAQQKLHKDDGARQSCEAYLKLNPDSAAAEQAKKALAELKEPTK
jgi:tetratricopeptide (TPR) repeat protein